MTGVVASTWASLPARPTPVGPATEPVAVEEVLVPLTTAEPVAGGGGRASGLLGR